MTFYFEMETDKNFDFDYEDFISQVMEQTLDYMNCPYEAEVNVVITNNESICEVNKEYRNIDAPTDVLSFPAIPFDESGDFSFLEETTEFYFNQETGELLLGDIMLSIDKVFEQAKEYGHSIKRELSFLIVHSILHLCGYDHMEEEERILMEKRQDEIMNMLGISR